MSKLRKPFIPEDAEWYLADIVQEITVEEDPRNVVHINTVLVNAKSPEEAYARALELGRQGELSYPNRSGRKVMFKFRGLRDLNVIHEDFEHGAELIFTQRVGISDQEIRALLTEKSNLNVFRPFALGPDRNTPDYVSGEVTQGLIEAGYKLDDE